MTRLCFASRSGADVNINLSAPIPTAGRSQQRPGLTRKNSSLVSPIVQQQAPYSTTAAESKSKKLRPFFPSDFSLHDTASSAIAAMSPVVPDVAAEKTLKSILTNPAEGSNVPASRVPRSPFVLMFGDHTYQQYCVGLQVPVTVSDPRTGATITTNYVLCLMTQLPHFTFLFHLIELFEAAPFHGLRFSELVAVHDVHASVSSELRLLSDLSARLKRTLVSLYPYLVGPDGAVVDNVKLPNVCALLPDQEFSFSSRLVAGGAKLDVLLPRSMYQPFYSAIPAPAELRKNFHHRRVGNSAVFVPDAIQRSEREREDVYLTLVWALPVLLRFLPLDQIILALGCAVTEMRIVVKHSDFHVVSSVILALMALLRPLKWCSPVIVILPDSLAEFIESPVPILIGLQRLPEGFVLLERFVVIDPQERIVHLNPADVVVAHTILLPHASKLVNVLRAPTEAILRLTRKKKALKARKTVIIQPQPQPQPNQRQSMINLTEFGDQGGKYAPIVSGRPVDQSPASSGRQAADTSPSHSFADPAHTLYPIQAATSPAPAVMLPMDLDPQSSDGQHLLSAVKTFSGLVANHIEAIVNTAIQMQHEEKNAARTKRKVLEKAAAAVAAASGREPTRSVRQPGADRMLSPAPQEAAKTPLNSINSATTQTPVPPPSVLHHSPVHRSDVTKISGLVDPQPEPLAPPNVSPVSPRKQMSQEAYLHPLEPISHVSAGVAAAAAAEHVTVPGGNHGNAASLARPASTRSSRLRQSLSPMKLHPGSDDQRNFSPKRETKGFHSGATPPHTTGSPAPHRPHRSPPPRYSLSPQIEQSRVSKVLHAYEETKRRRSLGPGSGGKRPVFEDGVSPTRLSDGQFRGQATSFGQSLEAEAVLMSAERRVAAEKLPSPGGVLPQPSSSVPPSLTLPPSAKEGGSAQSTSSEMDDCSEITFEHHQHQQHTEGPATATHTADPPVPSISRSAAKSSSIAPDVGPVVATTSGSGSDGSDARSVSNLSVSSTSSSLPSLQLVSEHSSVM